jgi:hypothetical protein
MKRLKLSTLTKELLKKVNIRPVNVEDYTEELINECFPDVVLLDQYTRHQGSLVRQTDEVMFRMCCRDNERMNVDDKNWIEVDGDFYDVDNIIQKFTDADFEIENDL